MFHLMKRHLDDPLVYAGIGSRQTPEPVLKLMEMIAKKCAQRNTILRSGGATGADNAFEQGCDSENGDKEIFLPWPGYNGKQGITPANSKVIKIAQTFIPNILEIDRSKRLLLLRNIHIILGKDLRSPCGFVICWTKDESMLGGTGFTLRVAKSNLIIIKNLANRETFNAALQWVNE